MILGTVLSAKNILSTYMNAKVRGTFAYKMMKFIRDAETEEEFFTSEISQILDKYAQKTPEGNLVYEDGGYKIEPEHIEAFQSELNALQNTEVERPRITFTLSDFEDLSISANEMCILSEFMDEDK